ncbi:orotate phosphoribosyltransferase [Mycoplasmatota bacterium]|nr:orotate phosphoribosyltransferase [Mycoplasmatota bacterium]
MEKKIAKYLLDINAVTLQPNNPYTWASGILAPIYTDNRLTLSYPKIRKEIELGLAKLIKQHYPDVEMIMGTATAGIAHAALVADILDLPMGYVRTSAKTHGKTNAIEGKITEHQKVVVIEDLISTGKSSLEVVKTLREKNVSVLGVVSIFSYLFKEANLNFSKEQISYHSLSNYNVLIHVALEENYITNQEFKQLSNWYENPTTWTK